MFGDKADHMPDRSRLHVGTLIAIVAGLASPCLVTGQTSVTLAPAVAPSSGQAGITVLNVTGAGFPAGAILPAAVTVSLAPSAGGPAVTTPALAVTTIVGATRRVTFTIPGSISVATP